MGKLISLMHFAAILALLGACLSAVSVGAAEGKRFIVYVGTMGDTILSFRFDAATGELTSNGVAAEASRPAFVELHPNGRFLYSVGEVKDGVVRAFSIDRQTGKLTLLNEVSSKGAGPAHVNVDPSGKCAMAANYGSGSIASFPILPDGRLGEAASSFQDEGSSVNTQRQQGPHAHSVGVSPDGRFAIAADLGVDKLFVYKLDAAAGKMTPAETPFIKTAPGAGPRHTVFHPSGKFLYAINELANTVTVYAWGADKGTLSELQTISTLPPTFKGKNTSAEVRVHPNGKFLYGSNRGDESLVIYSIDPEKGTLKVVDWVKSYGITPRNFNLDPTGDWLIAANQASDNLVVFRVDPQTGKLTPAGTRYEAKAPTCIRFLPVE